MPVIKSLRVMPPARLGRTAVAHGETPIALGVSPWEKTALLHQNPSYASSAPKCDQNLKLLECESCGEGDAS